MCDSSLLHIPQGRQLGQCNISSLQMDPDGQRLQAGSPRPHQDFERGGDYSPGMWGFIWSI